MILQLETATEVCSVALAQEGKILAHRSTDEGQKHSLVLTSYIQECLEEAKTDINALKAVAISGGPGSYTGLRVGCSTAKGICYSLGIPLIAVSTLESLIQPYINHKNGILMPALDARRMEVYTASFSASGKRLEKDYNLIYTEEKLLKLSTVHDKVVFIGNGAQKISNLELPENISYQNEACSALKLTKLAYQKYLDAQFEDLAYYEPYYLKAPNITIPKKLI